MQFKASKETTDKRIHSQATPKSPQIKRIFKPSNRKTLEMLSPTERTDCDCRTQKRLKRLDQKTTQLPSKQTDNDCRSNQKSPGEPTSRKISLTGKTQGPFKKQKPTKLIRNCSQHTIAIESEKSPRALNTMSPKPMRFKYGSLGPNEMQRRERMLSAKGTAEDKLVRKMISEGLDTGAGLSLRTAKTCKNNVQANTSDEDYEVSKLKLENQFMRSLYHKLIISKERDKIRFAESEAKLKRDRQFLINEVQKLKSQLSEIKQSKKIRIDHLFTHKKYDKLKNTVQKDQQIKQVPFHLQESNLNRPFKSSLVLDTSKEYYEGHNRLQPQLQSVRQSLSINLHEEYAAQNHKSVKKALERKSTRDEEALLNGDTASDSFYSLGLESAGSSAVDD